MEGLGIDPRFWGGRRVLVTGHTGFKGAWLALWLRSLGARVSGLALRPASLAFEHLGPWEGLDEHLVDLRDAASTRDAVAAADPEVVFHLAARSLVRDGYEHPAETFATNVLGTVHLLEALRDRAGVRVVVLVTTDKVYAFSSDRPLSEDDPLGAADPYSTSKTCVEHIAASWRHSWPDLQWRLVTARAGNVIGGGDTSPDRLLPDALRALAAGEPLRLRYPRAVRPWQHVVEPLAGYLRFAQHVHDAGAGAPAALNFGPDPGDPTTVAELADLFFAVWGEGRWEHDKAPAPAEAATLRIDPSRARAVLGWRPTLSLAEAVRWTVEWERARLAGGDVRALALEQIRRYGERGG